MKFDAFTGTQYENITHYARNPKQIVLELVIINNDKAWYPLYDWCGRYIGAVLDGQFQDVENIRKQWNYHEHKW